MKKIHYIYIVALLCMMMSIPASATTYDIYPTNSTNTVLNIMSNQAQPGDTLYFHAGTYDSSMMGTSHLNIENITWKGEGADVVTLDTTMELKSEGVVLDGFNIVSSSVGFYVGKDGPVPNCTVRNCVLNGMSSATNIGSSSSDCSNFIFENNTLSNTSGSAGLNIYSSSCKIINNTFIHNSNSNSPLYVRDTATFPTISGNTLKDNAAKYALTIKSVTGCTVADNIFQNNTGKAIRIWKVEAKNNTITGNNIFSNGGSIYFYDAGEGNQIFLNNFVNNTGGITYKNTLPSIIYWNSTKPMEYSYNGTKYTAYMGNFWDTAYTGSDTNANGIGEKPYTVSSLGTDYVDYAPLITGIENYSVIGEVPDSTVLSFDPGNTSVIEEKERQIQIMADSFPRGISKYNLTVNINNPDAVEIRGITYPSWASDTENSSLPGTSVYLKACENETAVQKGAKNVVLATLTVYGKEFGASANLSIEVEELKDDSNDTIETTNETCKLKVTMKTLPVLDSSLEELSEGDFYTSSPQDLDGDGLYEDLNGNGEFMFADIVTYFHDMNWIEENLQKQYFDFNGNQNIDYDDVRTMFKEI